MSSRWKNVLVVISGLLAVGVTLRPVAAVAVGDAAMRREMPRVGNLGALAGHGLALQVLGGYRGLTADALWLGTYRAWSARDRPTTSALIHLVTLVDDRPLGFWINGSRMLAYDMAQWRLDEVAGARPLPAALVRRIREEQAEIALRFLDQAQGSHPNSADLYIEMGNIHLNLRGDLASAADWYRKAAESPDAPYFAARIRGELLKRLGRPKEAYTWLCQIHRKLPVGDERAMRDVVFSRIRSLEVSLAIPSKDRYVDGSVILGPSS